MLCIMDQPGLWGRGSWNGKVLLNVCQAFIAHLYERYPATNKYAHETKQKLTICRSEARKGATGPPDGNHLRNWYSISAAKFITVESVERWRADIALKGRIQTILIPGKLGKSF